MLVIEPRQPLQGELMSFYIDEALVVTGMPLEELPLPEGAAVTLIVRKNRWCHPAGHEVEPGDHVHIIAMPEDRGFIQRCSAGRGGVRASYKLRSAQ